MNGHTEMPAIGISTEAGYDMMHGILKGWTCRVWLTSTPVILVGEWIGEAWVDGVDGDEIESTELRCWNKAKGDYTDTVFVATDDIRRVEIM
jgi:hypothetical protein